MIVLFLIAFFTKQELLWVVTLVIAGTLMFTSFNIEYQTYEYNASVGIYEPIEKTKSYPYMMGLNLVFAALTILLGLFDMFEKYGLATFNFNRGVQNSNVSDPNIQFRQPSRPREAPTPKKPREEPGFDMPDFP